MLKHDIQARDADRNKLAAMVEQFIKAGGQIKQATTGAEAGRKVGFNNQRK